MADVSRTTRRGQSHQVRGQSHGHGHPNGGRPLNQKQKPKPQQQQQRRQQPAKKTSVIAEEPAQEEREEEKNRIPIVTVNGEDPRYQEEDVGDGDGEMMDHGREERIMITEDTEMRRKGRGGAGDGGGEDEGGRESPHHGGGGRGTGADEQGQGDWNDNAGVDGGDSPPATPPPSLPPGGPRLSQEKYDVKTFNASLDEFVGVLSDPRYQEMRSDYPVDDLMSVVSMVTAAIQEYKEHSMYTQHQLYSLRDAMKTVKENLHLSITRQAFDLKAEEAKTIEELELQARLTEVNAAVARSHGRVAEASRLTAETEQTALQASIAAQQAKHEAERIEEEIRLKAEVERKKREEEEKRLQQEERRRQEDERKRLEEEKAKEQAKRKSVELRQGFRANVMESWTPFVYSVDDGTEQGDLRCIIRGHPATFHQNDVTCNVISQSETPIVYGNQEELVSRILAITPTSESKTAPVEPIYVAIPYLTRLPTSREAVVKGLVNGEWEELVSQEVSLDGFKEYRFVQAKVSHFTTLLVMSRFKRDYLSVQHPRRYTKLASTYDHRIVMTIPKDTFSDKQEMVLQVQPIDSATVSEFRSMAPSNKDLLTSSPILIMEWETQQFQQPITVTVPCPPNPARAKKMALLKKQKEEKLKAPKVAVPMTEEARQKRSVTAKPVKDDSTREGSTDEPTKPTTTKWYMGQYGQTEDDENDKLCLMAFVAGKWAYMPQIKVVQSKIDLVSFCLDTGYERIIIFRTRVDVVEDQLKQLVNGLTKQLSQRYVRVITKQRADDPYSVCCNVVLTSSVEKAERQLRADGYTEGPDKYPAASIKEGESIVLQLRGNLKFHEAEEQELKLFYNSNLPTASSFVVLEVDRYLQRNYNVFRGALRVMRRYEVSPSMRPRKVAEEDFPLVRNDVLCDIDLEIPKYHVEPDPVPKRASVVIHEAGPVDKDVLLRLAGELGDEWQRLGDKLHVSRVRQQAIIRTAEAAERKDEQAKFNMLLTWLKRCPQASDKVTMLSNALAAVGRKDLSTQIRFTQPFSSDPTRSSSVSYRRGSQRSSLNTSSNYKERAH